MLTGFHGLHVACGIAVLVFLFFACLARAPARDRGVLGGDRRAWSTPGPTTGTSSTPSGSRCSSWSTCCEAMRRGAPGRWMTGLGALAAATALLAAIAGAGMIVAPPAAAHTELEDSDPAAGSRLERSPSSVTLTFSERPDVGLSLVRIVDSAGTAVPGVSDALPVAGAPRQLSVALREELPRGVYTVNWLVVSAEDGHVEDGLFTFGVRETPLPGSGVAVVLRHTSTWTTVFAALAAGSSTPGWWGWPGPRRRGCSSSVAGCRRAARGCSTPRCSRLPRASARWSPPRGSLSACRRCCPSSSRARVSPCSGSAPRSSSAPSPSSSSTSGPAARP